MGHWIQFFFGFRSGDGNSPHYLFWSGAGSDISELAIIGAVLAGLHRVNCHVKGCWRVGRQHVAGTAWVVCHHHHPAGAPGHQAVIEAHAAAAPAEERTGSP